MKVEISWKWYELLIHPFAVMSWLFKGVNVEQRALVNKYPDVAAHYARLRAYSWAFLIHWMIVLVIVTAVALLA